ncbi:hypothetical protein Spp001_39 [Shewanella phage Spp001]|uniref:Uncharacterized protein n=1 Tax=Shewanella phage Spp001 TaxID=1445859 RepID=W6E8F3_9CAUD|nr:hypothetical protein Spp001_39 [Shewanella phage Spp001]AHJ10547.1 hypothetical protein Spp001_39 [Shewanella phage Spp001]
MLVSDFTEDQELVLDIMKEWLREQDAAFLALEEQVVFWAPIDGNVRKYGWIKLKLKEAVSIVRATKVPVGLMKHCTDDMMRAAAQEEDRTYVRGVTIVGGVVSPEYFNFHTNKRSVCERDEHIFAVLLVSELEQLQCNIMWKDLSYLYEQGLKYLGLPIPNVQQRNGFLRYGLNESPFIEKRNNKRYNGRYVIRENGKLRQLICIKLPDVSGIKEDWTRDEMRRVILAAVKRMPKTH